MKIEEILNDEFDENLNSKYTSIFPNKVVLLTGAAGSIGKKLSQFLLTTAIKKIVLVDNSEINLYDLEQTLLLKGFKNFNIELLDITCQLSIDKLLDTYKPHIVYHAAAYKHVPLLENFPNRAFKTNTLGTKNLVDSSIKYNTEIFVLISTDKAVYPKSVMGVTKRMAEIYVGRWINESDIKIKIVRFGNIPNTAGSVLPLWKKQLKLTNKIQVVNQKMFRYFVSLNQVCQMLLQVAQEEKGSLFVSKMGDKININELATVFLEKNQLNNKSITYSEKRPGEKEEEILMYDDENLNYNDKSNYYVSDLKVNKNSVFQLDKLITNYKNGCGIELKMAFNKVVSEYDLSSINN